MSPLVLGEILGVIVTSLSADGKSFVQDCENLQLPSQTQLSEKRKNFSEFHVTFLQATSNFKHFEKSMIVRANVFLKLQTVKSWLDLSINSAVSEQALTVNIWKHPKYLRNLHGSAFIVFSIILRLFDSENASPGIRWNLRGVF